MSQASILVTGGAGMIGSNLVKRLVHEGHRVQVVDNLWRGARDNLLDEEGRPAIDMARDFHELDLRTPGMIAPLIADVDFVFHLADVVAGIGYVSGNQLGIFRQNVLINSNVIADVARNREVRGFIYVGTACSFPAHLQTGVDAPPLVEEDQYPAAPESAYGWSKLMGEYETELLELEAGVPVGILVLHNVYGTPCVVDEATSQVIPALARKVVEYPANPVVVWGSGDQGRAFVHVRDVVDALISCMHRGLGQGPIQIGPDRCTRIAEIARTLVEISEKQVEVRFDRSKPEGDRGRCADYSKARRVLGWSPTVDFREGLEEVYAWVAAKLAEKA